jgi:hypothetical protein
MLLKIAALLVSLSLVAERAAGRSFPVRYLVLAVLRRAEAIARAFVVRETQIGWADWPGWAEAPEFSGHPADAASLALGLRMLALILADFVEAGCVSAGEGPFAGNAPCEPAKILLIVVPRLQRRSVSERRPWDTS